MATFEVQVPDATGQRVELVLHGVRKTRASLILRIRLFAEDSQPLVAGHLYTYGEGPELEPDIRDRFAPMELSLDVTQAMRQLRGARHVSVGLDILDAHGREVLDERLSLEGVELRTGVLA
jgi:hypothetical protein